ncbi:Holliday junction DNA helicase RuvA [candidate division WOR-1 bacterium RIFOXYB2_FULL_48_7]|uniref:Putative pre-16S rRNA nuclease n=1 Tax=candidate division WOR-1 bacterium RIFOXYB2_FULL_48_7 TaxID=1802583 RepID=A0A1F4TLU1_UNCSA|nr:MAG: Holliday junction DNA helicase RuvA [candidate division WOR-1 bacterium RIFOXYB2_FULL_48_7]
MRILGIDHGDKRVGLALSDPLGITAQPLATISAVEAMAKIKDVIIQYPEIALIVVGLPKNLRGEIGPQGEKVQQFMAELKTITDLKIISWDERFSTKAMERELIEAGLSREKRKSVIDKLAAAAILQNYLDSQRHAPKN